MLNETHLVYLCQILSVENFKNIFAMEISEIKSRLTLKQVLQHYNLKPDKNLRLNCPFHDDKTPSFQVYYKTHTCYCFSSNCKTHGKSLDVIDFIMYMENTDKHNALLKATELIGQQTPSKETYSYAPLRQTAQLSISKEQVLQNMFTYFKNAVHNSKPARDYIKQRGLDYTKLEIGYNTGQFHHGNRRDEALINNCVAVGLLSPSKTNNRKPEEQAYKPFAKFCIVFALRNRANHITGLYFRSTINESDQKHYYLKDRSGLYPSYPKPNTKRLILTEAIIDASTLLQLSVVRSLSGVEVLACFGTNGLSEEHRQAIAELRELEEIIFAFDNDEAGNKAVDKYAEELISTLPHCRISTLTLPENEDINSVYLSHQPEVFTHLLENRTFLFSTDSNENKKAEEPQPINTSSNQHIITSNNQNPAPLTVDLAPSLDTENPYKLRYITPTANYYVQGGISKILDSMKITLVVEHPETLAKSRNKIDLYEDKQTEKLCKEVSEKLNLRRDQLETDLYKLTDRLDQYREKELEQHKQESEAVSEQEAYPLTLQEREQIENTLKQTTLIQNLNELLEKTGIAGEETNRLFLLIIAISYKMPDPLHALIQGSSGSGKTRLLRQISDCIPPERVIRLTRVSDKGFYNYPEKYLKNKLISLEDIDGLGEEAEFAFRELQSNGELNSATSIKLDNGQIVSGQKTVKGPIASLACTTQGEIYEDNMSRVFLIAVDESKEQTQRIIQYQNNKAAGEIDSRKEQETKRLIQNLVRELKPYEVVNPFANKIHLPETAHKIRRLNDLFQSFVKMITIINQYQRKKDERNRLITQAQDIETAINIMFESILLKVDELDGSLRQFFEKLKKNIEKKGKNSDFTRFEVREATGLGKTQQHHYITKLLELEYIQQHGFANKGFKYKIVYWDDYSKLREEIKNHLQNQLRELKP